MAKSPKAILRDLIGVDFPGLPRMGVLMAADNLCAATVKIAVVADGPAAVRATLIGLTGILNAYATLDAALADPRSEVMEVQGHDDLARRLVNATEITHPTWNVSVSSTFGGGDYPHRGAHRSSDPCGTERTSRSSAAELAQV